MKRFSFLLGFFLTTTVGFGVPPRYQITGQIDVRSGHISATETVDLSNSGDVPLTHIHFFLYPNRFQTKDPALNGMNYRWHYPSAFDPGWLKIASVQDAVSREALAGEVMAVENLPQGTVYRVSLPEALGPGDQTSLRIEFECKIPHKYGPFGRYQGTLTAQGGWHPYLVPLDERGRPLFQALPAPSRFQIRLTLNDRRDVVVNGSFFDDVTAVEIPDQEGRYVTLVAAPQFYPASQTANGRTVLFYRLEEQRHALGRLMETLVEGVQEAALYFPAVSFEKVVVVETYLRAVMTFPGQDMILMSDRSFASSGKFDLRNLNRLEVARAVARSLVSDAVVERENILDYNWVAELLAWAFRNEFLATHFKELSDLRETAGRMGMFRPFNRMAAAPTIPFSETYIAFVPLLDPLRESLLYFNHQLPSGQLFAEKLARSIEEDSYRKVIQEYLQQSTDFQSLVEQVAGTEMSSFFGQWKRGYPPDLNYALTNVRTNEKTAGGYQTRFTVRKATSQTFVDPLEIRVQKEGGESSLLVWSGQESEKSFEVETPQRVTRIEIDPRFQTVQTDPSDDLEPEPWETVMDRGDVDLGSGGLGAGMRFRFHKKNDRKKWMFVLPFFTPSTVGVETGMLFDFGPVVDGLPWKRKHEIALSYTFTDLRDGFADDESRRIDSVGESSAIEFRYSFDNRVFEEDPANHESIDFTAALYREEFGGDFNFFRADLEASKVFSLHPKHKLGGIVKLGFSEGFERQDEVPTQNLFDLSSNAFISFADAGRFLGENALAAGIEWRHDLMSDLSVGMPMNMWIRRVQGVLSFGSGWVAPHFDELFRLNRAVFGVGYGLRFYYDFLGIRPSNFTFDVGYRLGDGPADGGTRFLFAAGILQTF